MISSTTALYANGAGGLPIIDPACNVLSSYLRSQPTRVTFPTEIFRLQSSSIKNLSMNGNIRYTNANMSVPNYYEIFQGLQGADPLGCLLRQRQRQARSRRRRLRRSVAGVQDRQP